MTTPHLKALRDGGSYEETETVLVIGHAVDKILLPLLLDVPPQHSQVARPRGRVEHLSEIIHGLTDEKKTGSAPSALAVFWCALRPQRSGSENDTNSSSHLSISHPPIGLTHHASTLLSRRRPTASRG